jgi:hypothetical protein
MILKPTLKNMGSIVRREKEWVVSSVAPWWSPFSVTVLSGILRGAVLRVRFVSGDDPGRFRYLGVLTCEFVLRGYALRDVRAAWARTPWSEERKVLLSRLSSLQKRRLRTEGVDTLAQVEEPCVSPDAESEVGKRGPALVTSRERGD